MESDILDLLLLQKSKVTAAKPGGPPPIQSASSCCTHGDRSLAATNAVQGKEVCCTPSQSPQENDGACCVQPSDGSACCKK